MTVRRALLIAPLAVVLLAGCAPVVDGSGSAGAPSAGATGDFPSASAPGATPSGGVTGSPIPAPSDSNSVSSPPPAPAPNDFICPDVNFLSAQLSFKCLIPTMRHAVGGPAGDTLRVKVEDGTNWQCEIGVSPYTGTATQPLPIVTEIRKKLLDAKAYGDSPTVRTDTQGSRTIDGHPAYVLASTMTLNPTWAAKEKTKVKVEKLWVVAILIEPGKASIWYASVPDLRSKYWASVPTVISSIKVD